MASLESQDRHTNINNEAYRNKSASVIFNALKAACGISALSYLQVTRWINESMAGRGCLEDNPVAEMSPLLTAITSNK